MLVVVAAAVVVVVASEGRVVPGVVTGTEVRGDNATGLRVLGGKMAEVEKKADLVFSRGVAAAARVPAAGVEAAVGCIGAVVTAPWAVMLVVGGGMVVKASAAAFGAWLLERTAALLPPVICTRCFAPWVEDSVVGVGATSSVAASSDTRVASIAASVVSSPAMLNEVVSSVIADMGRFPAVTR